MATISYEKLFAIKENILKVAGSEDLFQDLNRAVEEIIAGCDDGKMNRSFRREIIELISSIEMIKIRFLLGNVRAKDLHREVEFSLQQFRMRYQNFDYQVDPIFSAYFLIGPHSLRRQGRTAPRDKKGDARRSDRDGGRSHMNQEINTT